MVVEAEADIMPWIIGGVALVVLVVVIAVVVGIKKKD